MWMCGAYSDNCVHFVLFAALLTQPMATSATDGDSPQKHMLDVPTEDSIATVAMQFEAMDSPFPRQPHAYIAINRGRRSASTGSPGAMAEPKFGKSECACERCVGFTDGVGHSKLYTIMYMHGAFLYNYASCAG